MSISLDLSIIVPTFNSRSTIEKCLNSLLSQAEDSFDFEIVVVNDGSVDGTEDVLSRYSDQFTNIRVINLQNSGPSVARNAGVVCARGRWITFCDSDDWIDAKFYKKALSLGCEERADIIVFGYKNIRFNYKRTHRYLFQHHFKSNELAGLCLLHPAVGGFVWNKIYKHEVMENIKFEPNINFCEDLLFNLSLCEQQPILSVLALPFAPYNYDLRASSLTRDSGESFSIESVVSNYKEGSVVSSSVRAAMYANSVKTAFHRKDAYKSILKSQYLHDFYCSKYCPLSEKLLVFARQIFLFSCKGK